MLLGFTDSHSFFLISIVKFDSECTLSLQEFSEFWNKILRRGFVLLLYTKFTLKYTWSLCVLFCFCHAENVNVRASFFLFCLFSRIAGTYVCVSAHLCVCMSACVHVCACVYLRCGIKFKDGVCTLCHLEKWVDLSFGSPWHQGCSLWGSSLTETLFQMGPLCFQALDVLSYFLHSERPCKLLRNNIFGKFPQGQTYFRILLPSLGFFLYIVVKWEFFLSYTLIHVWNIYFPRLSGFFLVEWSVKYLVSCIVQKGFKCREI